MVLQCKCCMQDVVVPVGTHEVVGMLRYCGVSFLKPGFLCAGDKGPPVVLVHGFGASAYHWRYNIPVLAASHRVYAVDLLGFGWSDKPLIPGYADYSVWQDQLAAFIREVCATTFLASASPGRSLRD
jgi:pimeloyl-ACP methyl ester carboxylesterase